MAERRLVGVLALLALAAAGCRGWTSSQPPVHVNPSMYHQPKYRAQAESGFFYDGATMRAPVPGTVARGELREDRTYALLEELNTRPRTTYQARLRNPHPDLAGPDDEEPGRA